MRKSGWVVVGLVGLAIAGAAAVYERPAGAPSPVAETPPPAPPQPQITELRGGQPKIQSQPAEIPAPRAPAVAAAPDLPSIEVAQRPVHVVPDEDTPAPRVSLFDRSGKEITPRQSASVPRSSPPPAAPSLAPFIGNAQAGGGTALTVAGKNVKLFGVRVADARDRCSLGPGDSRSCGEVARDALAQRLKRNPSVSCRIPAGQQGDSAAVCVDASGTDLGGFLVAEGLALADTSQSYEYFGSEGVARYFGRGLWRYRR
jgi:endonuclease YncB( thermonuclease family)